MQKVLIITYYWPPAGGPGVQRWLKLSKYLPEFGIDPIILTVNPEDASYPLIDESLIKDTKGLKVYTTKTKEIYSLYQKVTGNKKIPVGGGSDDTSKSIIKKIPNFIRGNFFIPDPRIGWKKYALEKANELIKEYNIGTVITTSPPHSVQLIGLELRKRHNIQWIADFRDPWTDIYFYKKFLRTKLAKRIDANYEKKVLSEADKVFTAGRGFTDNFMSKLKNPNKDRFFNISNGYDDADIAERIDIIKDQIFTITYTGKINSLHDIEALTIAIKRLKEKDNKLAIRVRFVGGINDTTINLFDKYGLSNILEHIPYIPHKESVGYLFASDMQMLVTPNSTEIGSRIVNAKLFEYLASHKPILTIGPPKSEVASILKDTKTGKTFDYKDADGIYNYLESTINNTLDFKPNTSEIGKYSRRNIAKHISELLLS